MRVFAAFNIKGGVGKTATAVNLAWLAAAGRQRVLLVDLDPQGAASFTFRVRPKARAGAKRLVRGRHSLADAIRASDYEHLDIVPADFSFRNLDLHLDRLERPKARLRELLAPLAEEYDLCFLDCAPGISLASENVFEAADYLVSPTLPSTLSLRTLAQLMRHLKRRDSDRHPFVMPFFSMVDRRRRLHTETIAWARSQPLGFLETEIPHSSDVERMSARRAPLAATRPRSKAALAFAALWEEVGRRVAAREGLNPR